MFYKQSLNKASYFVISKSYQNVKKNICKVYSKQNCFCHRGNHEITLALHDVKIKLKRLPLYLLLENLTRSDLLGGQGPLTVSLIFDCWSGNGFE